MIEPGVIVGNYQFERLLGAGGMGAVWLTRHVVLGSQHAIKVLDPRLVAQEDIRDRFLAEGRIQAQIVHPGIVRVTDMISEQGIAALVMEYVDGPTLEEWIDSRQRPATSEEIAAVFLPLVDAMGAVHARGIVHRDLKPSNMILRGGAPVLIDFGIARVTEGAAVGHTPRRRTRTGAHMGTASYMSPEQIRAVESVDARSDIFALGAILYELATGRVAFDAGSEFEVMRQVIDGEFTDPDALNPVPAPLAAVIRRALATDPAQRWPDCAALAQATRAALTAPTPKARARKRRAVEPSPPSTGRSTRIVPPPAPLPPPEPAPSQLARKLRNVVLVLIVGAALLFGVAVAQDWPLPGVSSARQTLAPVLPARFQRVGPSHATPSWIVLAGAYSTEPEAVHRASELRQAGFDAGHLWIPDYPSLRSQPLWAAFIGPARQRADAQRLLRASKAVTKDGYGLRLDTTPGRVDLPPGAIPSPPSRPMKTSFPCGKARTDVEVAICSEARLGALDLKMAGLYFAARDRLPKADRARIVDPQRAFIAARDRCERKVGMSDCIFAAYTARITALSQLPTR